ncbi:VOC family protein [Mycolicibacterium sp. HK-90]|uniref:VOC family protein n=1 Tax=Mycolicibacterium sp. HK-90 TaxID=3056937 RepID=UPI00265B6819|nr:VOC family protein [Mycolicibacterium sp. HK-90]WKG01752.1 VOC family protein [Mycolicibacterium sp. HK-90]
MSEVLPSEVRQLGYVVTDLDGAMADWLKMGVGPWFVIRNLPQRVTYRGESCEVKLSLALSNSGDLQVELIQQLDDTPSIFTEFLAGAAAGGFHQLAYWADDFDAAMAKLTGAGWPLVWSGGGDEGVRFAYFEPPTGASIVEIMELTEASAGMAEYVRAQAAAWDGRDPVRELGG